MSYRSGQIAGGIILFLAIAVVIIMLIGAVIRAWFWMLNGVPI